MNGLRRLAARQVKDAETETRIEELIAAPSFPARGDVAHALQEAQAAYPGAVRRALQRRIAARLDLPFRAHEFLAGGDALDEGPVVEALLDAGAPEMVTRAAFVVAGPKTVGAAIDRLFELHQGYLRDRNAWGRAEHQAEREEYRRLRNRHRALRGKDSFLTAVLEQRGYGRFSPASPSSPICCAGTAHLAKKPRSSFWCRGRGCVLPWLGPFSVG